MRDPCADHPWSGPPSPVATSACSSSIDCAKTQKRAHPILECYVIFLGSKTPWCRQRDLHKREFPTRVSSPSNGAVTPNSGSNNCFRSFRQLPSFLLSPLFARLASHNCLLYSNRLSSRGSQNGHVVYPWPTHGKGIKGVETRHVSVASRYETVCEPCCLDCENANSPARAVDMSFVYTKANGRSLIRKRAHDTWRTSCLRASRLSSRPSLGRVFKQSHPLGSTS